MRYTDGLNSQPNGCRDAVNGRMPGVKYMNAGVVFSVLRARREV